MAEEKSKMNSNTVDKMAWAVTKKSTMYEILVHSEHYVVCTVENAVKNATNRPTNRTVFSEINSMYFCILHTQNAPIHMNWKKVFFLDIRSSGDSIVEKLRQHLLVCLCGPDKKKAKLKKNA